MIGIVLVGVGSFLGGVLRYGLSTWVHQVLDNPWFPYGTLTVNVLGCLIIGFLVGDGGDASGLHAGIAPFSFRRCPRRFYNFFVFCPGNIFAGA